MLARSGHTMLGSTPRASFVLYSTKSISFSPSLSSSFSRPFFSSSLTNRSAITTNRPLKSSHSSHHQYSQYVSRRNNLSSATARHSDAFSFIHQIHNPSTHTSSITSRVHHFAAGTSSTNTATSSSSSSSSSHLKYRLPTSNFIQMLFNSSSSTAQRQEEAHKVLGQALRYDWNNFQINEPTPLSPAVLNKFVASVKQLIGALKLNFADKIPPGFRKFYPERADSDNSKPSESDQESKDQRQSDKEDRQNLRKSDENENKPRGSGGSGGSGGDGDFNPFPGFKFNFLTTIALALLFLMFLEAKTETGDEISFQEFKSRYLFTGQVEKILVINKSIARVYLKSGIFFVLFYFVLFCFILFYFILFVCFMFIFYVIYYMFYMFYVICFMRCVLCLCFTLYVLCFKFYYILI